MTLRSLLNTATLQTIPASGSVPSATTTSLGLVQLAGVLAGTATAPTFNAGAGATVSAPGVVQLAGVLAGTATVPAFNAAAFGTTGATACVGNDARVVGAVQSGASPYDLSYIGFGQATVRAVGLGDNPFGIKLQRAAVFTSVTFRVNTADASGNLVAEIRKNGATVVGTSTTIAAASQVAGGTSAGSWSFAVGDILTIYITGIGTTPGNGLSADIKGTA